MEVVDPDPDLVVNNILLPAPQLPERQPDVENEPLAFVQVRHFFPGISLNQPGPSSRPPPPFPYNRPQDRLNNRLALLTLPRPEYETVPSSEDMSLRLLPNESKHTHTLRNVFIRYRGISLYFLAVCSSLVSNLPKTG